MTYPLLDHCNRRNAAELARVVNLSAAELVRVESIEWAPPTEELRTRSGRRLGRGDRIYCGMPHSVAEQGIYYTESERRYFNVCRPFDERHMESIAAGHNGKAEHDYPQRRVLCNERERFTPMTVSGPKVAYAFRPENDNAELVTPPSHGHGAACRCAFAVDFWQLSLAEDIRLDGRDQIKATLLVPPDQEREVVCVSGFGRKKSGTKISVRPLDCPNCAGTGRVICDDDRAGRVSPSHAAGGYAEWQQQNAPRITGLDWGTGPTPEILRIWETRRRVLDGVLTTIAAHSPDFPRERPDDDQAE